jgi:hypothetical protein
MNVARTKGFALSLILTLAVASGTVVQAGSITNGNFTPTGASIVYGGGTVDWTGGQYGYQPTGFGWDFTGGAGVQQNGSAWGFSAAPGAGQSAFLQSYNGSQNVGKAQTSSISQDLSGLTNGQQYTLSFDLSNRPGYGAQTVTVTIDGVTFTILPTSNSWTEYYETFTYNGGPEDLTFSVTDPPTGTYDYDTGLADISIAETPEPGTLLLFGSGLLGFAGLARRKFASRNA